MYDLTIDKITNAGKNKANLLKSSLLKYLISAALAGSFIGFGIILTNAISSQLGQAGAHYSKIIGGVAFAVALNLVIFTSTELFTGNNLVMSVATLNEGTKLTELLKIWLFSYIGNMVGAIILSFIFVNTGFVDQGSLMEIFSNSAVAKASASFIQLLSRGILCNVLVCFAILMTFRTDNDAAKVLLNTFCILAFVIPGFEHSVANMTVYAVPLLSGTMPDVTLALAIKNLIPVTIGNIIGGGLIVGLGYYSLKSK